MFGLAINSVVTANTAIPAIESTAILRGGKFMGSATSLDKLHPERPVVLSSMTNPEVLWGRGVRELVCALPVLLF